MNGMIGYTYDKRGQRVEVGKTYLSYLKERADQGDEEAERKLKQIAWARKRQEKADEDRYYFERSKGYCPKCGLLLPLNGHCECED